VLATTLNPNCFGRAGTSRPAQGQIYLNQDFCTWSEPGSADSLAVINGTGAGSSGVVINGIDYNLDAMDEASRTDFLAAVVPSDPSVPLAPNGIPARFASLGRQAQVVEEEAE
jgi:hypothetical protein